MKKTILVVLAVFVAASIAVADDYKLTWSVPDEGGTPDGYVVYWSDGAATHHINVGNVTEYLVSGLELPPGTYTIYVQAYNVAGMGPPSNEVGHMVNAYVPPADDPTPENQIIRIPGPVKMITIEVEGNG